MRTFLRRVYEKYENNTVSDTAASLSYYFVFSLFPFMFFLATLTAYLPLGHSIDTLVARLRPLLPPQAMAVIDDNLRALIARPRPRLLTVGLVVTLYSASRGVDAVRKGLNLAYDVKESRPFWKTELLAFGATLGGAALLLFGVAALVAGGDAGFWVARHLGLGEAYLFTWKWIRWPITAVTITLIAALGYYFLPDVKQKFKYITPGSIGGTVIWLVGTWGFSQYVSHFGTYNITYGSIGGVIVLMTWLFISGFIFSMGGEVNAILEHASREGKAVGARAEGEAPPPADERPSAMPPGAAASQAAADRAEAAPVHH
ncbi:MAG TPA: YihY/virulence factor BrkB family protein [Polyangia bacterium]|jgi:membrane protein